MSKTPVSLNSNNDVPAKDDEKKMKIKSLKELIFLGRIDRSVVCGDFTFNLRSITVEDQKNMVIKIMKMPEEERLINAKIVSLAFSVYKINGVPTEEYSEAEGTPIDKKIDVLSNLQASVINKLFKNYEEILEESNSKIEIEEVKK